MFMEGTYIGIILGAVRFNVRMVSLGKAYQRLFGRVLKPQ